MTSQTTITADPEQRSLRGCADALDALARVIGPTYSTIRGVQALVVGDRVTLTAPMKAARSLARALGFDPNGGATHSAGLVTEWRGIVADLDVQVFGKRDDERALRQWDEGARVARAVLAAQAAPVPDRLVSDVLGAPDAPAHIRAAVAALPAQGATRTDLTMTGTYRVVREHITTVVERRVPNAEDVARAEVRAYLQTLDEGGFLDREDIEAADAAFLTVFGVTR